MSDFKTLQPDDKPLDPHKRTRYADGFVLRGDDLSQDQLYHLEKHRLHQRALHGYGPVCGLDVWMRGAAEVVVEPGLAVSPRGQTIRVPAAQCASLDEWLAAHREEASPPPASPPDELELFVVLCYRECLTDPVPVPSGPCRTADDAGVASRVAESFELELRTAAPAQAEEDAVRELGELLRRIEIVEGPGGLDRESFEAEVRALAPGSPPPGSPPDVLRIHPDDAAAFLRAALRIWSREIRPRIVDDGCGLVPPREECVLLARLTVPVAEVGGGTLGVSDTVEVDEVVPPILLSTRLLQEWLFHLGGAAARPGVHAELEGLDADDHLHYLLVDGTRALGGDWSAGDHRITDLALAVAEGDALPHGQPAGRDLSGQYPDPIVRGLQGNPVAADLPEEHHVLRWNAEEDRWEPGLLGHAELEDLEADDHPQYLLADGTRPLSGDWGAGDGGTFRIREVAAATDPGDVLVHGQAAGRDLDGTYPDPTVVGLQGNGVSDQSPKAGQFLMWDGTLWIPASLPVERDLTRIFALSWRHGVSFVPPPESPNDPIFDQARTTIRQQIFAFVDQGDGVPDVPQHLVVGFGRKELGDARVHVGSRSLDKHSFLVLLDQFLSVDLTVETSFLRRRFITVDPIPVRIENTASDGRITHAVQVDEELAEGAAMRLLGDQFEDAVKARNVVTIVIKGDFVLDDQEKAIDAQHLRSELPSGERPRGSEFGTQGGTFESWFAFDGEPGDLPF